MRFLISFFFFCSLTDNERKRFRRPISSFTKAQTSENNILDGKVLPDLEASSTANRFKLYHRTSKPFYKSKTTESNDLDTAASVNRPTALHRHVVKHNANLTDIEAQETVPKVTRLLSRRGPKPKPEAIQEVDQETSPSINRNNIQRRISKPSQGNSLLEGETSDQENLSSTNRLKIRRRISKPENLNSATDEVKLEDQESSLSSRFKIRQKLNGLSSSSVNRKSGEEPKDDDGYKVRNIIIDIFLLHFWASHRHKVNPVLILDL